MATCPSLPLNPPTYSVDTNLFAVVASSTSQTDAADDGDDDAERQQDDDGQEQAEVLVPDRAPRLRHELGVDRRLGLWTHRLDNDRLSRTHLHQLHRANLPRSRHTNGTEL